MSTKYYLDFSQDFGKKNSIESCLSYLNDKVAKAFESGLHTGMILIDLQKAFDTITHDILTNKMEFSGFSSDVICWFKSYLSKRKFTVNLKKYFLRTRSSFMWGTTRIYFIGPLLFLLYINDMPKAVLCELHLYADDTCLIFQHKDMKEIEKQL